MARRICMWIAVVSLSGIASAHIVAFAARYTSGGRIMYTSTGQASDPLAAWVLHASGEAQRLLVPVAALSSAAYMLLLDRHVRRGATIRGFDIEPPAEPPANNPPLERTGRGR